MDNYLPFTNFKDTLSNVGYVGQMVIPNVLTHSITHHFQSLIVDKLKKGHIYKVWKLQCVEKLDKKVST